MSSLRVPKILSGRARIVGAVALVFALLAGSVPFENATAAPPDAKPGRLDLRAVEAATGDPVDGATIAYRMLIDGGVSKAAVTTDENGAARIEWKAGARVEQLTIIVRKPKFAPFHLRWRFEKGRPRVPESQELRLEPGTTIGGIVKDEDGRPIAGATVLVLVWFKVRGPGSSSFPIGSVQTDDQGRWRLEDAPRDLTGVSAFISHPEHRRALASPSHNLNSVCVLPDGLTLKGRIVDGFGRPVPRAEIVMGERRIGHPATMSDERGEFVLENCEAGPNAIIVHARGFAPRIQDVKVAKKQDKPVEVRMIGPGATLRVKIVDERGGPVPSVLFSGSWRGHFTLGHVGATDKDGRLVCRDAPEEAMLFDFAAPRGYLSIFRMSLTATDQEQVIVLHPELVVSGNVTDAFTGRPIDKFRVVKAWQNVEEGHIRWYESDREGGSDGRFVARFDGQRHPMRFDAPSAARTVRIEAPGYKPAESRTFRADDGPRRFDFVLKPAAGLTGTVELPDGRPAAGAEVALVKRGGKLFLQAGKFSRNNNVKPMETDADGQFAFQPPDGKFLLIAIGDGGYAKVSSDEFAKSRKVVLQPWGKIDGGVRAGARRGAGQHVMFQPARDREDEVDIFNNYSVAADENGRFLFERVAPGSGTISRAVVTRYADGAFSYTFGWQAPIDVRPGQTAQVTLGGKGRPVVGRLVLDGVPDWPVDWTRNEPVVASPQEDRGGPLHRYVQYVSGIDQDGRFRVEDVPAGRYDLTLKVSSANREAPAWLRTIGQMKMVIAVPEISDGQSRSNEPLDLGDVPVKRFETLKIGDRAPDFRATRIDGDRAGALIQLNDFRGKLVLLHFWFHDGDRASNPMADLKDVHATFGKAPRFQMIGLSSELFPRAGAGWLARNPLPWPQGFVRRRDFLGGVTRDYKLWSVPASFLIGPDGHILAKNLEGPALKDAIARALKNDALFKAKTQARTPE